MLGTEGAAFACSVPRRLLAGRAGLVVRPARLRPLQFDDKRLAVPRSGRTVIKIQHRARNRPARHGAGRHASQRYSESKSRRRLSRPTDRLNLAVAASTHIGGWSLPADGRSQLGPKMEPSHLPQHHTRLAIVSASETAFSISKMENKPSNFVCGAFF